MLVQYPGAESIVAVHTARSKVASRCIDGIMGLLDVDSELLYLGAGKTPKDLSLLTLPLRGFTSLLPALDLHRLRKSHVR